MSGAAVVAAGGLYPADKNSVGIVLFLQDHPIVDEFGSVPRYLLAVAMSGFRRFALS